MPAVRLNPPLRVFWCLHRNFIRDRWRGARPPLGGARRAGPPRM